MKKHFMRFTLCFMLVIAAVLSYAVLPTKTSVDSVKADTTNGPVTVKTEIDYTNQSYEDYATLFTESWYTWNSEFDDNWLNNGGEITNVRIFEWWNDDWDKIYDANDTMGDVSDDYGMGSLMPGKYAVQYKWSAGDSFAAGESSYIEFEVVPNKIQYNFDSNQFTGVYADKDNWYFAQDHYWVKQHDPYTNEDDVVDVVWCYDNDGEDVELDNSTDAGTYMIYPVLKGAHAWRYSLNLTYSNMMEGIYDQPLTKENPVACTITKRDISVKVKYLSTDLLMYADGGSATYNSIHYNGVLPLVAYCPEFNVKVSIDWFRDSNTYEQFTDGISKVGSYFATSSSFSCVEEESYLNPNNFTIVDSNVQIKILQRTILVEGSTVSKYCNAPSYPDYDVVPKYDAGEDETNVLFPQLSFDIGSTIPTDYLGNGHAILVLDDPEAYIIEIMGGMDFSDRIEWDYTVTEGDANIEATQIRPWYYGEVLDDIKDIFDFNVYTSDPEETVEIYSIEWTFEAFPNEYTTWHNFVKNDYDPESGYPQKWALDSLDLLTYGLNIRVTTDYSSGKKYTMTSKVFHVEYAKAPVYIRVIDEGLTFNNEDQAPSWENYRFYIFNTDSNDNLWDTASVYVDIKDFIDYYYDSTLDEYVPHVWGTHNSEAGKYSLLVVLTEQAEQRYELIQNEYGAFTMDEIEIVDPDSYYEIHKKSLTVDEYIIPETTYGEMSVETFLSYHTPTVSGFITGDNNTSVTSSWYFNTQSKWADDEEWLPIDQIPGYPYANAGEYFIKYVGEYANYATLSLNDEKLVVKQKELSILWFESEDRVGIDDGVDSENSTIKNIASYTYNGLIQKPHFEIYNYYTFDVPTVTESKITTNTWDEGEGINVGSYFIQLTQLSSKNYIWPHRYNNCVALYKIEQKTLTLTPDSGLTKVYGENDPELTYTVSGAVEGDTPVFAGALSRVAGQTAGLYDITIGTLDLTSDEVNYNYNVVLNATPVKFEIEKKEIIAHFSVLEKEYTSNNLNPDLDYFEGIENGDVVEITYPTNSINAGRYDKRYALAGKDAGNYVLNTTEVSFLITQATLNYTAVLDDTNSTLKVEFDGELHTLTVDPTNIKENDGGKVALNIVNNATGTTAGTYVAKLEITGDRGYNYKFADGKDKVTWTITPKGVADILKVLESAFAGDTVTYDASIHTIKTVSGVNDPDNYLAHYTAKYYFDGEEFSGATEVGTYNVEIRFTSDDTTNYPEVTPIYKELVINQREVTITWTDTNYTYDGTNHMPTASLNNVAGDDELEVLFNTTGATNKSNTTVIAIGLDGDAAANYKLGGTTQITMIISAREITVKADDKESVYGNATASLTYTITEGTIVEGDDIDTIFTLSCTATTASAVRDYTIKVTKGANKNYDVTTVDGTYNITKRDITITADPKTSVYGENLAELTAQVTAGSLVNGDTVDKLVNVTAVVTPTSLVADNYLISVSDKGNANYNVTTVNAFYALTAREITVKAIDQTSVYGDNIVELKATVSEGTVVNGEKPYELDCDVKKGSDAGTYTITVRKTNNNYIINTENATYTVTARPLTIAIADKTSIYGEDRVKLTSELVKGSYAGDDIANDVYTLVCGVNGKSNVGTYNITGSVTNDNYAVTFINGTKEDPNYDLDHGVYTVTERALLITVVNKTSVYGDNQVALEGVDTNGQIVNNDTDVFALTCEVTKLSHVGLYNIIGSRLNTNYNITFANEENSYEVTKKDLRVIANNDTVTYGDEIPDYTVEYDGFVNNENEEVLSGELSFACDYTNTSLVNTYAIVPSGLTSNDYEITFIDGTLTVERKAITVTYTSTHKEVTYGDEEAWTALGEEMMTNHFYLVADWVGEDTVENSLYFSMETKADGTGSDVSENLDPTLSVGTYYLVVEGKNVNNYIFTITLGDEAYLTVNKKALTITADDKNIIYGNVAPVYTASYSGFVNGEDETVLGGELAFAGQYNQYDAIGDYTITPSGLTSDNYEITFVNGTCTVAQRVIDVTIANKTSIYGDEPVALTATEPEGSIVNNDVAYTLHCTVTRTTLVGNYDITGRTENANYVVNFTKGTYKVTQREVTLTWTDDSFTYDEASHKPTATAGNLVNNDVVVVTVTGEQVVAGTHTATASMLSNVNYILPAAKTHEFTIAKAPGYDKPLDVATVSKGIDLTEIFNNVDSTAADTKIDLTIGDAVVTFDKAAIDKIAGKENVVFKFETVTDDAAKEIYKKAVAVFEISLSGVTFDGGTVTVTTKFENNAPFGKVAKLYYIDGNKKTDMKATFENDEVTFDTTHFSTFAVVYTLSTLSIIIIILVVLAAIGAIVYFVVIPKLTKGGETPATTTDEVAETEPVAEETTEEPVEEETTEEPVEEPTEETAEENTDNE